MTFQPFPPDHYIALYLSQVSADTAAGYILGNKYPVSAADNCLCPHCQMATERERMTNVQPHQITALQVVSWHVANAGNEDRRFRGDVEWAKGYLAECVSMGWLTEGEANEIRTAVGWAQTAVQMRIGL